MLFKVRDQDFYFSPSTNQETSCDQSEGSCSSEEEEWKSDRRSESDSESSRYLFLLVLNF